MYVKLIGLLTICFKETAADNSMANLVAKESGDHVEQKGLSRTGWRKKKWTFTSARFKHGNIDDCLRHIITDNNYRELKRDRWRPTFDR